MTARQSGEAPLRSGKDARSARPGSRHLTLLLRPWQRPLFALLNVVPLAGLGAILAGSRNPHTVLLRNGIVQAVLVVFGAYPLILPGAIGIAWGLWDGLRIARSTLVPPPPAPRPLHPSPPGLLPPAAP